MTIIEKKKKNRKLVFIVKHNLVQIFAHNHTRFISGSKILENIPKSKSTGMKELKNI